MNANHLKKEKKIAGTLTEKNGKYHMILNIPIPHTGKTKQKWVSTGLSVKGNKKRAEAMLLQARTDYAPKETTDGDILFSDYMERWLIDMRSRLEQSTYSSYTYNVKNVIVPYFKERHILLSELLPVHIHDFYCYKANSVSGTTLLRYHNNIRKALKTAMRLGLIQTNPADMIDRPKMNKFIGSFYNSDEFANLMDIAVDTPLELPIYFAGVCGMRRSEVMGLRWRAFDFSKKTVTINHTRIECKVNGKKTVVYEDTAKNKSSLRTLILDEAIIQRLQQLKERQKGYQKVCGKSYNTAYLEYICVDPLGNPISCDYVTSAFKPFLAKHGLREIRYHDLRHTCASILIANGASMKMIQDYLGHSDYQTTANIYAHLDSTSKEATLNTFGKAVELDFWEDSNGSENKQKGSSSSDETPDNGGG